MIATDKSNKMELVTLYVYRSKETYYNTVTTLKDTNGKVKAIIAGNLKQPRKGTKKIRINCFDYLLNWDNVK